MFTLRGFEKTKQLLNRIECKQIKSTAFKLYFLESELGFDQTNNYE